MVIKDSRAKDDTAPPLLYRRINSVGKLMLIECTIESGSNSGLGRRSSIKGRSLWLLLDPLALVNNAARLAGEIPEAG